MTNRSPLLLELATLLLFAASSQAAGVSDAQGPGNGLAKSTYAASPDAALEGMNFLMRLLNTTAALDGSPGNVGECPAGSSGVNDIWYETEGRSALPVSSVNYGTCWIKHGEVTTSWSDSSDLTSVMPPTTLGEDCQFESSSDVQQADGGYAYVVLANSAETCCKSCTGDKKCTGAVYREAVESSAVGAEPGPPPANPGKGFGLHMTALPGHSTEGAKTVEEIEEIFSRKLGDMSRFDWFMDYNVGIFTYSLDEYITRLQSLGASFLPAKWTYRGGVGFSVFIHVGKTQLVVELMGLESELLSNGARVISLEQRMTDTRIEEVKNSPPEENYPFAVSVSRAISSEKLASLEDFYTTGVGATVTRSSKDGDVEQRCYQWPSAAGDVCFRQRPSGSTSFDFTPLDFENMMENTQKVWLSNPNCGMMRWEDNHYAHDSDDNFDHLMEYVLEKNLYYVCGGGAGAHYVYDPSGWGVQLDVQFTKVMPGCSSEVSLEVSFTSPWCDGGTCSTDVTV